MFPARNHQVLRTETTFLLSSFLLYSTLLFHASGFICVNAESFFHCTLENAGFTALTWFFWDNCGTGDRFRQGLRVCRAISSPSSDERTGLDEQFA